MGRPRVYGFPATACIYYRKKTLSCQSGVCLLSLSASEHFFMANRKRREESLLAGACGANYRRRPHAKAQRRGARKGKKKGEKQITINK